MKDPKGGAAPVGGFKDLGWYNGYQYFQGSFAPQAGQIHPNSPQQGAGQKVSSEVNKQSDAAQGLKSGTIDSFVANQNATPNQSGVPAPTGGMGSGGGATTTPGSSSAGGGMEFSAPAPLNLPALYDSLYKQAGISDMEAGIAAKQKAFNDAQLKINDNPYLSEANRVGRIQKLTMDYNNNIKTDTDMVAMKKADVEMRLNLEQKQFDINSQSSQQALQQFNTLLSMGALDGASGEDIANITRSTGLSSQAIQSAIKANQAKNVQTSVIQYDDGTNQGFAVVNTQTGDVINRQVVGASKPSSSGSGVLNESRQFELDQKQAPKYAADDAKAGKTLKDLISFYQQWIDPQQIYSIYNANSRYGVAKEDKKTLASYGIKK